MSPIVSEAEFAAELTRIRRLMLQYASRLVGPQNAQDVWQDACLRAWRKLHTFKGKGDLGAWIRSLVFSSAMNSKRRRIDKIIIFDPDPGVLLRCPALLPDQLLNLKQHSAYLRVLAGCLTPKQHALLLEYLADKLDPPVPNRTKILLHRLKLALLKEHFKRVRKR